MGVTDTPSGSRPLKTDLPPHRAELFFNEGLLSPVTHFSDNSTTSESSFYDYLLVPPTTHSSHIRKELFETFNAEGPTPLKTDTIRNAIPGYVLLSNISSDLYRGFNRKTKRNVLVKYVSYISAGSMTRFFNEWYVLSGVNFSQDPSKTKPDRRRPYTLPPDIEGVLYATDFISLENSGGYAFIYDDILNLRSFNEVFVSGRIKDDKRILSAIIACVETLKTIHSHRITHNGLTSSNILINDNDEVYITGWDFCFSFFTEDCTRGYRTLNKRYLLDWLPYMAPEVSGEMNCLADYRADFYSIGVILYQMLTSTLPFIASDSRELINKHIRETPMPLTEHGFPNQVNDVVMKLLSKKAQDRYLSCEYLLDDLNYLMTGETTSFEDASKRMLNLSHMPRHIFGREQELKYLESLYDTTGTGVHLLLIKGAAGCGKTRLVGELQSRIVSQNHYFAQWKCNTKTTGFASFISILNNILHQITASSEADIIAARECIIKVAGSSNMTPLFVHLPELAYILGPNYSKISRYDKLSKHDHLLHPEFQFRRLIKCLFIALGQRYPLTIFFDDFQWFSLSDIELLNETRSEIIREQWNTCIIVLATFDSSNAAHLEDFKRRLNSDYIEMAISEYRTEKFLEFAKTVFAPTQEMLSVQKNYPVIKRKVPDVIFDVSNYIHKNVLMATRFIETILIHDLMVYDPSPPHPKWVYQKETISSFPVDSSEIYDKRLFNYFNEEEMEMLVYAACVYENTMFSLHDLAVAVEKSYQEVSNLLIKGTELSLVRPMNIFYKYPFHLARKDLPIHVDENDEKDMASLCLFSLAHDTLYTYFVKFRLDDEKLAQVHRTIGLRFYHDRTNWKADAASCMEIADHFAKSWTAVTDPKDCKIYIEVFKHTHKLCNKTFDSIPALKFLNITKSLLAKFSEITTPEEIFRVDFEIARYMLKTRDIQGVIDFIKASGDVFLEDPRIVLVYVQALSIQNKTKECVQYAVKCLNKNGIAFDSDPSTFPSQLEVLKKKLPTTISEVRKISRHSDSPSNLDITLHEIMAEIVFLAIYQGDHHLSSLVAHYLCDHALQHGHSGFAAVGYVVLAIVYIRDSLTRSKEFSQFALALLKTGRSVTMDFCNKVFYVYVFSIGVYLEPIDELLKFYELYSASSAQLSSTWSINFIMKSAVTPMMETLNGVNLQLVYRSLVHTTRKIDLEDPVNLAWYNTSLMILRHFLQMPYDPQLDVMRSSDFDLERMGFFFKCYYFCAIELTNAHARGLSSLSQRRLDEEIGTVFETVPYNLMTVTFQLRHILSCVGDPSLGLDRKKEVVQQGLDFYGACKANCVKLFEPKYLFLLAEMLNLDENSSSLEVLDAYERAIESAQINHVPLDIGWFNERCGRWLLHLKTSKGRAFKHLQEAAREYQAGGHNYRVSRLKQAYPDAFDNFQLEASAPSRRSSSDHMAAISPINYLITSVLNSKDGSTALLDPEHDNNDFFTAIKATLSVSESINTDAIIENLVKETIAIVNATYAVVALRDDDGIIRYKAVGGPSFFNHLDQEDAEKLLFPEKLIQECFETGAALQNSSEFDHRLSSIVNSDSFFIKSVPSSFLCLPIKSEVEILGILYLENTDIPNLFTSKKLKLTELLCTQAAFALDKARLYYRTMVAKKAAEEATAEKATFLANMSHEIRTPFNSLFACAGFLMETELDPLQREYVETIQSSAEVTLNIIDAILTFSKIEHGSIHLENEWFSLNECIESAMQLISEQAAEKKLELAYFNKCGLIDKIKGDVTRFKQVIINLLGNSVKFTQSGSIVIESFARRLSSGSVYEFTISIRDTGIGIPKNSHSKVFGAFSQVDGSSRRVYGGSGLGLSISKKLIDLMGGTLNFESDEGEGTTFFLTLASSIASRPSLMDVPRGSKMLIVADPSFSSLSLKDFAQSESGCSVEITTEYENIKTLKDYLLVFITPKYYGLLPTEVIDTLPKRNLIIISPSGKIVKHMVKEDHPVLLLPFLRKKLATLVSKALADDDSDSTSGSQLSTPVSPISPLKNPLSSKLLGDELPMHILLVEDNVVNTRVALQHLKKLGYTADSAIHGLDALEKCAKRIEQSGKNYDLVLMDIQMPCKDGIEAAKDLREKYGGTPLMPVIVALTANVETEDRDRCIACGMSDFISKPIRPDILAKVICNVGGKARAR